MPRRVFIVDDEQSVVDAMREILERDGFEIPGWALTGEQAVRKYSSLDAPPDVTLMDYRLPDKSGIEVMADILRLDPSARVLFVSADVKARNAAMAAGAVGFILKPFRMNELLAVVRAVARTCG